MVGISRFTGLPISNLESAYQSVEVILMRRIGSLVGRREFGAGIVELLGRKMTPNLFAAFQSLIANRDRPLGATLSGPSGHSDRNG